MEIVAGFFTTRFLSALFRLNKKESGRRFLRAPISDCTVSAGKLHAFRAPPQQVGVVGSTLHVVALQRLDMFVHRIQ